MATDLISPLPPWEELPAVQTKKPQAPLSTAEALIDFAFLAAILGAPTVLPIASTVTSSFLLGLGALGIFAVLGAVVGVLVGLRERKRYRRALVKSSPRKSLRLVQNVDEDRLRLLISARDITGTHYLTRAFNVDEDEEAHQYAVEVQAQIDAAYEAAQQRVRERKAVIDELQNTAASIAQTVPN